MAKEALEGFECSSEESSHVESSSSVEEELTFMEVEVQSRARVLVRKSVHFTKLRFL